jgi:hypothetical protein
METLGILGIILGLISSAFGLILIIKAKQQNGMKDTVIEEKIDKLNSTLDACDKMIDELNKLSDYIITNVEEKSVELKGVIDTADKKISEINSQTYSVIKSAPFVDNENTSDAVQKPKRKTTSKTSKKKANLDLEESKEKNAALNAYMASKQIAMEIEEKREEPKYILDTVIINDNENRDKSKMFAFVVNQKSKEVLELSKQGMDTTEIAKKLGIGKGEIELILGLKK